jgi:hypothetical protein
MSEKTQTQKPNRPADPELLLLSRMTRLLEPLSPAGRRRVLLYLCGRYEVAWDEAAPAAGGCRHPGFGT